MNQKLRFLGGQGSSPPPLYEVLEIGRGYLVVRQPLNLVPVGGLEPPHPKILDFESNVSTNSTTPA